MSTSKAEKHGKEGKEAKRKPRPTPPASAKPGLIPDPIVIVLMVAAFGLGFGAYLVWSDLSGPANPQVKVGGVELLRNEGLVRLEISNLNAKTVACTARVNLLSESGETLFSGASDTESIEPQVNRTISVHAAIPAGKVEYDIQADCHWL